MPSANWELLKAQGTLTVRATSSRRPVFLQRWRGRTHSWSKQRWLYLDTSCSLDHPVSTIELLRFTLST